MKLILCGECQDVKKLSSEMTYCNCKKCYGRYVDDLNAEINKHAIPLGFNNFSLVTAIKNQPEENWGKEFTAFVIQKNCSTIKVIKEDKE